MDVFLVISRFQNWAGGVMYIGIELDLDVSVHGVVFISLITYWGKGKSVHLLGVIHTY